MSLDDVASRIKNPLAMVALFATISEVAMAVVLTQLPLELQRIFIWFVMGFPVLLVLLFFFVLYTKPAVLFSPGDYKREELYVSSIGLNNGDDVAEGRVKAIEETLVTIQEFLSRATLNSEGEAEYRELQRSLTLRQRLESNTLYSFLTSELRIEHQTAQDLLSRAKDGLDLCSLVATELHDQGKADRLMGVVLGFESVADDFDRLKSILSREDQQQ
jgi:hypothetical protein